MNPITPITPTTQRDPTPAITPTAVTIGTFDGVHLAHAALIHRARERAGPAGRVIAIAFDPHPRSVLSPGSEPPRLTTFDRRAELLRLEGADDVRRIEPHPALLAMTAPAFIRALAAEFRPAYIVEGGDFRFGRDRGGGTHELISLGRELGFALEVLPPVEARLDDGHAVRVSSSVTRWLIAQGRVADAALLLGRPYELQGPVVRGDRRGRAAGFPTVNLEPSTMRPADGVYAGLALLPDGRQLPAAINIGTRPTVNGPDHRVEAHLLGLPTSWRLGRHAPATWGPVQGLSEYGWTCTLRLHRWLRDQARFASFDQLATQLERDCARAQALYAAIGPGLPSAPTTPT